MSPSLQKLAEQIEFDYHIQAINHQGLLSLPTEEFEQAMNDEIDLAQMFGLPVGRRCTPDLYFDRLLVQRIINFLSLIREAYHKADLATKAVISFDEHARIILDDRITRTASFERIKLRIYVDKEVIHLVNRVEFCSSLVYIAKILES
jgi:hypothetical protein